MSGISVDVGRLVRSADRLDAAGASIGAVRPPDSGAGFFGSWAEESGAPRAFERVAAELRGRLDELARSTAAAGAELRAAGQRYAALDDGHAAELAAGELGGDGSGSPGVRGSAAGAAGPAAGETGSGEGAR